MRAREREPEGPYEVDRTEDEPRTEAADRLVEEEWLLGGTDLGGHPQDPEDWP